MAAGQHIGARDANEVETSRAEGSGEAILYRMLLASTDRLDL